MRIDAALRRLLLQLVIVCVIALCVLVGAARLLGGFTGHPAAALVRQFDCSPQPCWAGITPGMTSLADAENILDTDTAFSLIERSPTDGALCWHWQPAWHHTVGDGWDGCYSLDTSYFMLTMNYENNGLRLGDILALLDRPDTSFLCVDWRAGWVDTAEMRIYVAVPDNALRFTPELMVTGIVYSTRNFTMNPLTGEWAGFSRWAHILDNCTVH